MLEYGCAQWLVREAFEYVVPQRGDTENLGVRTIQCMLNKGLVVNPMDPMPLEYLSFFLGRIKRGFEPTVARLSGLRGFFMREDVSYLTHPEHMTIARLGQGQFRLQLLPYLQYGLDMDDPKRKRLMQFMFDFLGVFSVYRLIRATALHKVLDQLELHLGSVIGSASCQYSQSAFHAIVNATIVNTLYDSLSSDTFGQIAFKLVVSRETAMAVIIDDYYGHLTEDQRDRIHQQCMTQGKSDTMTC